MIDSKLSAAIEAYARLRCTYTYINQSTKKVFFINRNAEYMKELEQKSNKDESIAIYERTRNDSIEKLQIFSINEPEEVFLEVNGVDNRKA